MLRSTRAQPDWEHEGESALVAASSKAQIKCVNELIKAGADCNQRDSNGKSGISNGTYIDEKQLGSWATNRLYIFC